MNNFANIIGATVALIVGLLSGAFVAGVVSMVAFGISFAGPQTQRFAEILLCSALMLGILVAYGIGKSLWKDFKASGN